MKSGSSFFSRLESLQVAKKSHLMVGIDPRVPVDDQVFLKKEWVQLGTFRYLEKYVSSLIDACSGEAACIKLQSAFFEMHGVEGLKAMRVGISDAHAKKMLVLLDAKRGDISTTMEAYYKASFLSLNADAMTVQLYMGTDVLKPFFAGDFFKSRGVYVVLYSSNPSAKELQRQTLRSGKSVLAHFSEAIHDSCEGDQEKLSSVGFVVGATHSVDSWARLNLKQSSLLLPGVGAQGGNVSQKTFQNCWGLASSVPVSRGLLQNTNQVRSWKEFESQVKENAQELKSKIGWFS